MTQPETEVDLQPRSYDLLAILDALEKHSDPFLHNRAIILDCWKDGSFAVIRREGEVAGFAAWDSTLDCELNLLWIRAALRRNGLGTLMVTALLESVLRRPVRLRTSSSRERE